ncbi:unnamed protein product [Schistosoma mattheei]|uniref:Uncharacterized protein n=1 Tax=Schistosoma mattheei TaxID=31246 RepID=A0A183PGM7_9TREM|nr:unnamed protein product [Schistosoma mattheei]
MDLYRNTGQDSKRKNKKTAIKNSQTRAKKVKARAEYTEANKQVKSRQAETHGRASDGGRKSSPLNPPDIEATHTDLPIAVTPPTNEEIRMAIRQIKSGKAARPDNIPTEALKSDISNCKHAPTCIHDDLRRTSADELKTTSKQWASTYTNEKARSSNTTRRTPTQSHIMEKLWNRWKHSTT